MGGKTYLVQAQDGQLYGPADVRVLDQWAGEGRILAQTVLVEQGTNARCLAADLPELRHHFKMWNRSGVGGQPPQSASTPGSLPAAQPTIPVGGSNPYSTPAHTPYPRVAGPASNHNPIIATVLSFFCLACVGQFYNKQVKKGFALLAGVLFTGFVCALVSPIAISAVAAVDAYLIAKRIQRGETIGEWQWF